jgi:drug/metabolite transporter (DMT)-like permease
VRRPGSTDLMLISTVVIWAFNITVTKYVLEHGFKPLAYASVRYGAAALLFALLTLTLERSLAVGGRSSLGLMAVAALVLFLNQLAFVYSLELTSATTVALILGTTPVFTALVAFGVGLERPSRRFWIAAVITFGGVTMIALGSGGSLSADLGGDLLALGLAATWAVYSVAIAPLMRDYSAYRISALILLATWVPLGLVSIGQLSEQDYGGLSAVVWLGLAFAIVGPLALTNVLWFTAISRVGPSRATLFANVQPFIAAIIAVLVLAENLTALQVAGGLAIALGILLERTYAPVPAVPAD